MSFRYQQTKPLSASVDFYDYNVHLSLKINHSQLSVVEYLQLISFHVINSICATAACLFSPHFLISCCSNFASHFLLSQNHTSAEGDTRHTDFVTTIDNHHHHQIGYMDPNKKKENFYLLLNNKALDRVGQGFAP